MARVPRAWWWIALVAGAVWAGGDTRLGMAASPPAPRVPVVLELFTSEGCSSCPPADRLLADLIEQQPIEGVLIIGLGEHVDYWDSQGWKDPFSSARFSRRQEGYAGRFGTDRIYTPQMIVDGRAEFVGSDRAEALRQITKAAASGKTPVSLAWSTLERRTIRVQVAPGAAAHADVWLALVESGLSSAITRGENHGRTLRHAAVTRRLTMLGETAPDGSFAAEPAADIDRAWNASALTVVVFLQDRKSRFILGAATLRP